MRSQVFLGDAVQAALRLAADPDTTAAIGSLLGLPLPVSAQVRPPSVGGRVDDPATAPRDRALPSHERESLPVPPPAAEPPAPRPADSPPAAPSRVRRIAAVSSPSESATLWLSAEPLARSEGDDAIVVAEPEPLFTPEWTAALLAEALGVPVPSERYDIDGMVQLAATGQPLRDLRRLRRTLSYGVQLLIDAGPGMTPFAQDCARLRREVATLAGPGLRDMRFVGCPTRGAGRGPRPWDQYRPPPSPTPVLIVTDLGAGRPPSSVDTVRLEEWLAFAATLRRERCRPVTFVPYPRSRIPSVLVTALGVVEWDRSTTIASVRQAVVR